MEDIKRLLACVDLSDFSKTTLEHAILLSKRLEAEIIVLHVLNVRDIEAVRMASEYFPEVVNMENYIDDKKRQRYHQVDAMIHNDFPEEHPNMKILVQIGNPVEEILDVIQSENIDLVVMANKGKSNLTRTFFGSIAEKIFRHSPVPVVSIRKRSQSFRRS